MIINGKGNTLIIVSLRGNAMSPVNLVLSGVTLMVALHELRELLRVMKGPFIGEEPSKGAGMAGCAGGGEKAAVEAECDALP